MKSLKTLLLGVAGAVAIATAASATDITPVVPPAPPPPPPAPVFSWGGPYAGLLGNLADCGFCVDQFGGQVGIQAGYNFVAGSMVFGIQAVTFYAFSPVGTSFAIEADARAGFSLGERTLVYTLAGLGRFFASGANYFTVGGGAELAVTDTVSVFAQVTPYWFFGGGGPIWRFGGGLNWHFAY